MTVSLSNLKAIKQNIEENKLKFNANYFYDTSIISIPIEKQNEVVTNSLRAIVEFFIKNEEILKNTPSVKLLPQIRNTNKNALSLKDEIYYSKLEALNKLSLYSHYNTHVILLHEIFSAANVYTNPDTLEIKKQEIPTLIILSYLHDIGKIFYTEEAVNNIFDYTIEKISTKLDLKNQENIKETLIDEVKGLKSTTIKVARSNSSYHKIAKATLTAIIISEYPKNTISIEELSIIQTLSEQLKEFINKSSNPFEEGNITYIKVAMLDKVCRIIEERMLYKLLETQKPVKIKEILKDIIKTTEEKIGIIKLLIDMIENNIFDFMESSENDIKILSLDLFTKLAPYGIFDPLRLITEIPTETSIDYIQYKLSKSLKPTSRLNEIIEEALGLKNILVEKEIENGYSKNIYVIISKYNLSLLKTKLQEEYAISFASIGKEAEEQALNKQNNPTTE
ncbi:MAG: hypothetical protein JHC31_11935 [Sulfurihydrogenibium sp.]|jgi:hypothetical protein|nr:hypothetical protein [Sulfurihydrogenibium sp.]